MQYKRCIYQSSQLDTIYIARNWERLKQGNERRASPHCNLLARPAAVNRTSPLKSGELGKSTEKGSADGGIRSAIHSTLVAAAAVDLAAAAPASQAAAAAALPQLGEPLRHQAT